MTKEPKTEGEVSEPTHIPEPSIEAQSSPEPTPEPQIAEPAPTAQLAEPLNPEPVLEPQSTRDPLPESSISIPEPSTAPTEPSPILDPVQAPQTIPDSKPVSAPEPKAIAHASLISRARELLVKARETIQFRKRKKLEKIMGLFLKKETITNDDVQKLLYVSDATATRYLKQLETEGKIRRQGVPGHASYSRI